MAIHRSHTILFVSDQHASARFYEAVLGIAPTLDVPGMTEIPLSGGSVLGLMPEAGITKLLGPAIDPSRAAGVARAELYLVVDAPETYLARAIAAGAEELSPVLPRDWGYVAGYCRDPDRHVLAFASEERLERGSGRGRGIAMDAQEPES
jgi:catechol 2,3-dioxygenase-like lactoylglutathione lyase family enzyme